MTPTVDIVCPACESGYVLDAGAVGGEFHCPSCSHTLQLAEPTPAPVVARPPLAAPLAKAATSPPLAGAPVGATRTEIVCPRCQLHFAPEKHTVEIRPGDRPNILIVEEESYSRDATAEALSSVYDIMTAGTVDAAARILALGGIDLMILDMDIDHGLGRRLLLRQAPKICPILIYGNDESQYYGEEWETLRDQGADDMVIKGMNAAEAILRKVNDLLGRRETDEDSL